MKNKTKYLLAGTLLIACLTGCVSSKPADALKISLELKSSSSRPSQSAQIEFVRIPAGTFTMGSPENEEGRDNNEKQVRVTLSAFHLGKTEVTQRQWKEIMGTNPSKYIRDDFPVDSVSWYDAMEFCKALTEWAHRSGAIPQTMKFTLPTEAQWEYACRAGTTTRFHSGDTEALLAKYEHFSGKHRGDLDSPAPVSSYLPNPWGLYDMHGNVMEWCLDYYDSVPRSGTNPCRTKPENPLRIVRGSNWWTRVAEKRNTMSCRNTSSCRSAKRNGFDPNDTGALLGFRVALVEETSHVVARGDTLASISIKYYGTKDRWRDIYDLNRDILQSSRIVKVGTILKLPQE